jgi:nucleotide-binding universal stress UspA family protein
MIPQIKKILFTTDLTENSRHAFYYAASMATRYGAGIVILYVLEKFPTGVQGQLATFLGKEELQEFRRKHEQEARRILIGKQKDHDLIREALAEFCASAKIDEAHCSFETLDIVIKEGNIVDEILKLAAEHECDVIVMGAHKGLLGATVVGSTAKGVLHEARIPVLVVPPPKPA